jgi:uncharacterized protein YciI
MHRRYAGAVSVFLVTLGHGPGWDPSRPIREQEGFSDHATFMDGLVEQGFVLLGGPFKDGERSLLIVNGPDDQAVRECLAGDPWATAGMLEVNTVQGWSIWLDGTQRRRA